MASGDRFVSFKAGGDRRDGSFFFYHAFSFLADPLDSVGGRINRMGWQTDEPRQLSHQNGVHTQSTQIFVPNQDDISSVHTKFCKKKTPYENQRPGSIPERIHLDPTNTVTLMLQCTHRRPLVTHGILHPRVAASRIRTRVFSKKTVFEEIWIDPYSSHHLFHLRHSATAPFDPHEMTAMTTSTKHYYIYHL